MFPFLAKNCVLFGDFNVDIDQDSKKKAEVFLKRANTNFFASFTPEASTSLHSNRVIGYGLATN